jgi:hypothetical protein
MWGIIFVPWLKVYARERATAYARQSPSHTGAQARTTIVVACWRSVEQKLKKKANRLLRSPFVFEI